MRFSTAACVVSLGLLACTGQRTAPEPGPNQNGSGSQTGGGGAGVGGTSNVGGMGGAAGGMGGMTTTTTTTTTTTGSGGGISHPASEIYPYCGCIADGSMPGACGNCWDNAIIAGGACEQQASDCALSNCGAMFADVRLCASTDPTCFDNVQVQGPTAFDDLVALAACVCAACPAPQFCDDVVCQ